MWFKFKYKSLTPDKQRIFRYYFKKTELNYYRCRLW